MSLLQLSAEQLIGRVAGSEPTPGGGSVAALSGALAAALVEMVASMTKTRSGLPEERTRLDAALAAAREAGSALRGLADEDSAAFDAVMAAYRLPKASEDEKALRKAAVAEATRRATEVPLRTAEECLRVLKAAAEAAACGNPNAISDARTGAALAFAGLLGGLENVRINAVAEGWGAAAKGRAEELQAEAQERVRELGLWIEPVRE